MVTVRIFICFAFELNVLRFLLSRCRPCSRCFCWHIQSKMKQLKRQLVSMKPTRGLTSFAMNFLLEYGKGAGDGALLVPSPNSNKCKKYDHHSIHVTFSICNISAGNGSPLGICKLFACKKSLFSRQKIPFCRVPLYNQIKRTIGLKVADKGSLDDKSNGEHFNFIVECVNKQLNSNLSWAPSHLLWLSACRTYDFALTLTKNMNRWFKFIRL